jgi:hypothetical protein
MSFANHIAKAMPFPFGAYGSGQNHQLQEMAA